MPAKRNRYVVLAAGVTMSELRPSSVEMAGCGANPPAPAELSTPIVAGNGDPSSAMSIRADPPCRITLGAAVAVRLVGLRGVIDQDPTGVTGLPARSRAFPTVTT